MTARSSLPHPFFAAPATAPAARRLLLVSYSFPPDSSVGALRWEKLLGYAARHDWHADVIMMDPATAEVRDDSRLAKLPPGTRLFSVPRALPLPRVVERWVTRTVRALRPARNGAGPLIATTSQRWTGAITDPGFRGKVRSAYREYLAVMHYREWFNWACDAADVAVALSHDARYDLVVSSGPPQMAHEAARMISERTGLPFVMDVRDQFYAGDTQPPQLRSHSWLALTKKYERRCVRRASIVVANTAAIEAILRGRYPQWADKCITVMNGADPDVRSTRPFATRFTVTNAGSLYNGRDPRALFRGCKRAIAELGVTPDEFRIHFFGDDVYEDVPVSTIAEEEGVGAFTLVEKLKPRGEAIRLQEESAVVVILPQFQVECIPGKLFDYVQLSSWVLALSQPDTATELVLRGTTADILPPEDSEAIASALVRHYREFRNGVRPQPVNADGRFDRDGQATILFNAVDRILAERAR